MDLATLDSKEKARFKSAIGRVENMFPYIRGEEREVIAYQLAISQAMVENDVQSIDTRLVFWPQLTSAMVVDELPSKKDITVALKAYNQYRVLTKRPVKIGNRNEYEYVDILDASVKTFGKAQMTGVKFLGLLLVDGTKIRFLLDKQSEVKKKIERAKTHKFQVKEDAQQVATA